MMLTELNKLHRLRIAPLLLVMVVAVVLMSTFVMFKKQHDARHHSSHDVGVHDANLPGAGVCEHSGNTNSRN